MDEELQVRRIQKSSLTRQSATSILQVQIFSYYSALPFILTKSVTKKLIKAFKRNRVAFQFDFIQDNSNLRRLIKETCCISLKIVGIADPWLFSYIATSKDLRNLQLSIRATETLISIQQLSKALQHNKSLQTLIIFSHHETYPDEVNLKTAIRNHPTLQILQLAGHQTVLKVLLQFQFLPSSLTELQISAFLPSSTSSIIQESDQNNYDLSRFLSNIARDNQNLQRLGLCNMDLTTQHVDAILCHLPSQLLYLDLYGNPKMESLYFPKFEQQLKTSSKTFQLRELHSSLELLLETAQHVSFFDYLYTLFAKNSNLRHFGGNMEHVSSLTNKAQYQELLFLTDWNRSGVRRLLTKLGDLPCGLVPVVLERTEQYNESVARQASVLNVFLQQSSSQILV
jgi:hypothetical protein